MVNASQQGALRSAGASGNGATMRPRHRSAEIHIKLRRRQPYMNLVAALKVEITRVARKEVRAEVNALKKSVAGHRSDIAALKRQIAEIKKQNRQFEKGIRRMPTPPVAQEVAPNNLRFRPAGLASHRKRLGLSAQAMGRLLGVSGQSVTAWETGKTMPRRSQLPVIAEVRKMSKRDAEARTSGT